MCATVHKNKLHGYLRSLGFNYKHKRLFLGIAGTLVAVALVGVIVKK